MNEFNKGIRNCKDDVYGVVPDAKKNDPFLGEKNKADDWNKFTIVEMEVFKVEIK